MVEELEQLLEEEDEGRGQVESLQLPLLALLSSSLTEKSCEGRLGQSRGYFWCLVSEKIFRCWFRLESGTPSRPRQDLL